MNRSPNLRQKIAFAFMILITIVLAFVGAGIVYTNTNSAGLWVLTVVGISTVGAIVIALIATWRKWDF